MQLDEIKKIGPKTLNCLNKLGIYDFYDLISYYPFRYNLIKRSDLNNLIDDKIIIDGIVESDAVVTYLRNHKDKLIFRMNIGEKVININIFNRGFLKKKIVVGAKITVFGKYDSKKNLIVANDIRFHLLGNSIKIEPVYHVTTGINSSQLNNLITSVINDDIIDYVPNYLNEKYDFVSKLSCIKEIHNPSSSNNLKGAVGKLKYEELFLFMLKINYLKQKSTEEGLSRNIEWNSVKKVMNNLPFKLTFGQIKSIEDIYQDLISFKRMNRLLQGDVGSGKTIVAFISLYMNYLADYQGALMAPTEILAVQHYNNIIKLFPNVRVGLLTGKLKAKEKREVYKNLEEGDIDIVIGTHALISQQVKYKNLGLVITDEQHRFGVNQRSSLKNKGLTPDILYMSATPIPRTYAITLFGDMEISSIKTKPVGRKEIISYLKKESEIKDVLMMMFEQLKQNYQIYVIAPLIEESDKIELENVIKLQDKMQKAFGKYYKVGIMHGKLSNKEKEIVMSDFKDNKIQILISTTVIEVGVDVANATMMVIFDSYRFGLSALHQLRGRVGRSELQSYFVMISNQEIERLKILTKTNDGFQISEADFKLRGSGDLFGIKQSGDMLFKLADLKKDYSMLIKAREDSLEFIKEYKDKYVYIYDVVKSLDTLG